MKVSVFWTDASPAFHDMRDYYESLQGISPEMSADDIFMELSNLERVWRKRRISNPEKASEMLQIIEEAKEVFDSDETKSEYDRQLDLFKHPEQLTRNVFRARHRKRPAFASQPEKYFL